MNILYLPNDAAPVSMDVDKNNVQFTLERLLGGEILMRPIPYEQAALLVRADGSHECGEALVGYRNGNIAALKKDTAKRYLSTARRMT